MEISFSCLRLKLLAAYQSAFFVDKSGRPGRIRTFNTTFVALRDNPFHYGSIKMSSTDCSEHGYLLFNILNDNTDSCFTNNWISTQNGGHAWTRTKGYPKRGHLQCPAIAAMRRAQKNSGPYRNQTYRHSVPCFSVMLNVQRINTREC